MFCLCFTVKCWLLVPQVMRIWKRTLQRWNICTPLEKGKQPNRISVFLASFFLYHSRSPHLHTYYSSAMCRKSRHAKMDNFGFAKTDTLTLISFCSLSLSVRVCSVVYYAFCCLSRLFHIFVVEQTVAWIALLVDVCMHPCVLVAKSMLCSASDRKCLCMCDELTKRVEQRANISQTKLDFRWCKNHTNGRMIYINGSIE